MRLCKHHWYLPLPLTGGEDSEIRVEYHRGQCCRQCLWKVWSMATGTPGGGSVKMKEAEAGWYLVIYPFWLLKKSSIPSGWHWDCHGGSCFKALVLLEDLEVQRLRSTVVSVSSAISATAMLAAMSPRLKESYCCISDTVDGSPAPPRTVHPGKLTWNLKKDPWKRRFLLETIIFMFHVSFRGGIY